MKHGNAREAVAQYFGTIGRCDHMPDTGKLTRTDHFIATLKSYGYKLVPAVESASTAAPKKRKANANRK